MPTLKEALNASREGYTPIEASKAVKPTPPMPNDVLNELLSHPLMRTPLPTPNVSSDTLRPFNLGSVTPKRRMIAPETNLGSETSSNTTTSTTVITAGGSSSASSGTTSTVVAQRSTITTPLLTTGGQYLGTIQLAQMFAVLNCTVSSFARVELYSTNAFQVADLGRGQVAPASTTQHGVIMDLYLNTPDKLSWVMSPIADGANQDDPQNDFVYLTVTNLGPSAAISVTITFVPEET